MVRCRCVCGRIVTIRKSHYLGETKSCGCQRSRLLSESARKHGMRDTPTYQAWRGMKERCYNPGHASYAYYGARGIAVCERWRDNFAAFLADMGKMPADSMTIDRLDNDANYSPANCRWATKTQQNRNHRNTIWLEVDGVRKCMGEWAEIYGIPYGRLAQRIARGWEPLRALTLASLR